MTAVSFQARHYATGAPVPVPLEAAHVAPALFDLQINGCDGISFNSERLTPENVRHVVEVCLSHGIAGLCPTLVTNGHEALRHGFTTLARARREDALVAHCVPGFHLEGPYIAAEDGPRGAHPRQHVRSPDRDEFLRLQEAADGRILLVTLAPEHDNALEFIEWLTQRGVVVALGHTGAPPARIRDAIKAGARLATHLGNGCHAVLPRHDNYLWEQLAADDLWASLICDGHHLPEAVMRCLLRAKTPARTVLTCDASSLAGLPPGRYKEWDAEFEVLPGGKVVVSGTPFLAGSGVFLDTCVNVVLRLGVSLKDTLDMAGAQPRRLLGLPETPDDQLLFDRAPDGGLCLRGLVLADNPQRRVLRLNDRANRTSPL